MTCNMNTGNVLSKVEDIVSIPEHLARRLATLLCSKYCRDILEGIVDTRLSLIAFLFICNVCFV
jgi:hypothetical protein